MKRFVQIETPLPPDTLLLHRMRGREELGRLSEYELELLSVDRAVKLDAVLGKSVTVKLELADEKPRSFSGYVTRFSQVGMHGRYRRYHATVRPWLWFLERTTNCRIFQGKKVPEILKEIFEKHPSVADVKFELTDSYTPWDYCVQYRESDFAFVSRLMEDEGIYYFFKHHEGRHTLVIADSLSAHPVASEERIPFIEPEKVVRDDREQVREWAVTRELQSGKYALTDYDYEKPSVDLQVKSQFPRDHAMSDYEIYDYPGAYAERGDGELYARTRIEELQAKFERVRGATNARGLATGRLFTLTSHPRDDQNAQYMVISAEYEVKSNEYEASEAGPADYDCRFVALKSDQPFRPERITPKPFVQGPQTAVVVGPGGDEIYTDKYGRVKVQFHWDRYGKRDQNSSCWIRVSQPWAGKGWGGMSTPRIGQEVIVDFLEGDPDQPIITGRVYNAENQPPFGFPAGAVLSGIKSNTHKGSGNNELSMDDTAGKERVFIQGQYNMDTLVKHDQTSTIHNCRTDRVDINDSESIGENQKWDVGLNRDATIGANETLTVKADRTKSVIGNETITVGGNRDGTVRRSETLTVALQRTHTVGINETITVGAAQEITIGGLQAVTVGAIQTIHVGASQSTSVVGAQSTSVGAVQNVKVGAAQNVAVGAAANLKVGGDQGIKVVGGRVASIGKDDTTKVTKNFILDAGESITIKTGSASITMNKNGTIEIKGKTISIEGTQKIEKKAMEINSEAKSKHTTKGAMVNVEASGIHTIKGSLVKIN